MTRTSRHAARDNGLRWYRSRKQLLGLARDHRTLLTAIVLLTGIAFWQCLPQPLFATPYSTILLDRQGRLLGARIAADQQWRFPAVNRVPDKYRLAVMTFEDKRFYSHPGVDPLALLRALRQNLSRGEVVSGGSTLTMQVIRLARGNPPRTYWQKLIEILLATRLELQYSKDEILALYASHAPFGGNVVGLEAAAWRYFARPPRRLSWAEAATLAILPNSPALIHPGRNRQALKAKRDALLQTLHQEGHLTALELQLAQLEPLPGAPHPLPRYAPHLLDTLSLRYPQQHRFVTTLDRELQRKLSSQLQQHSQQLGLQGIHNAAALVIDNRDFSVLAYIGNSRSHGDPERGYAIDLVPRPRSTGSVLKPFLYASMLQQGEILPGMLVADVPTQYNGYIPENYDRRYRGAVPAKVALARSLNVPAVRMLKQHGVHRFYDFLKRMGMTTLHRHADDYGLTLILGGAEGSLWEITGMYANLAGIATGRKRDYQTRYRRPVLLASGSSVTEQTTDLQPPSAWLTLEALLDVHRPGTEHFWKQFSSTRKVGWKTGTSYGLRDGWAIGVTPEYTVGVWTGNASGEGRPALTGIGAAAPLLFAIFNQLPASHWFTMPREQMKPVQVCTKDGYLDNGHCRTRQQWIPATSHFDKISPYHVRVHLDRTGNRQVHSRCYPVAEMQHQDRFVLPPSQAFYYRQHHSDYRSLPPLHPDCVRQVAEQHRHSPIALLYPAPGTAIYIPFDLGGEKSRTVFEAVHRDRDAVLYWHLDDQYLGMTTTFHQQGLNIEPGRHRLTLVDQQGHRLVREFTVLGKNLPPNAEAPSD